MASKLMPVVAVLASLCTAGAAVAQPAPASAGPPDPKLVEDLVAAGRVAHAFAMLSRCP
jgi:hypothetical protein